MAKKIVLFSIRIKKFYLRVMSEYDWLAIARKL